MCAYLHACCVSVCVCVCACVHMCVRAWELYNVHVFSLCVAVKGVNTTMGWLCVHPGVYDG